ncbi:MAG: hypothetical protein L6V93_04980 [Clostridiales bacterium]|nr:MAG: hypothetical protein L6V93_04980 [Clostridiales bacterium]
MGENNLATGTEYTITVGDVVKTYITTGEKPAREFCNGGMCGFRHCKIYKR